MSCPASEYDGAPHRCVRCDQEVLEPQVKLDTWKRRAFAFMRKNRFHRRLVDAFFNGEFDCKGQNDRCGRGTNNELCADCLHGTHPIRLAEAEVERLQDAMEAAWVILANVSGGEWTQQSEEWCEAARKWRDNEWHAMLNRKFGKP